MSRAIPLALLLGAALVGCGKRGGDAPQGGSGDPPSSGGVTPSGGNTSGGAASATAGAPPTPTPQQMQAFLRTLPRNVNAGGASEPANGVLGPSYECNVSVPEAEVLAIRDPGFAFGMKLSNPKYTDAALAACAKLPSLVRFSLHNTKAVTAAGVAELSKMRNLRVLELTDLAVEDAWLAALKPLTEVRRLDLDGCYRVTDAAL